VRERPPDIPDSEVASALARQWPLSVQELSYLPVGFGGYHWAASIAAEEERVTVRVSLFSLRDRAA